MYGSNAARKEKVINVMTFNEWEEINNAMKERDKNKRKKEYMRMARYFRRQRLYGGMIVAFGIICIITGHIAKIVNMECLGILVSLAGLYVTLTKQMMLVDEYFLEYEDRMNQ